MKFVMEIEIKKIKRLGNWVDGIMLEMAPVPPLPVCVKKSNKTGDGRLTNDKQFKMLFLL